MCRRSKDVYNQLLSEVNDAAALRMPRTGCWKTRITNTKLQDLARFKLSLAVPDIRWAMGRHPRGLPRCRPAIPRAGSSGS